jgi:diphthine synthase
MPKVAFIGMGLNDEKGITLQGLEQARQADSVFAELYTNVMPNLNLRELEVLIGKEITVLNRTQLEDENGEPIVKAAGRGSVAFLVPGDPLIATTHISLRLELAGKGLKTQIIHAPSIVSAVCGATGLQSYKFGKSITVPAGRTLPRSVVDTVWDNYSRGLHTLLLLDVGAEVGGQMSISQAARGISKADRKLGERLIVGVARIGANDELVKAGRMKSLVGYDFGPPPHSLVLTGKLHFMEAEALKTFCGATERDLEDES